MPSCAQVKTSNSSSSVPQPPGKRDEAAGELCHKGLPFVHGADHVQARQPFVADLALQQGFWDHADDLAAGRERGVRDRSHESDAPSAVDEPHPPLGQRAAQRPGRFLVGGILSEAATAEDAEAPQELQNRCTRTTPPIISSAPRRRGRVAS